MAPFGTDSTAVLDAPVTDATPIDSSVDDGTSEESTDSTTDDQPSSTDTSAPSTEGPAADDDSAVVVNGKLAPGVAKIIKDAQQSHPRSAASLKKAVFEQENFRRTFPGGMKEAASYQQAVREAGGPEGLSRLSQENKYFNELDGYFTSGDPKFVEELSKPDVAEAFLKLGPSIVSKYAQMNPDGMAEIVSQNLNGFATSHPAEYGVYVAQGIAYDMSLPMAELGGRSFLATVDLLNALPIDNPNVPELLKAVTAYTQRIMKVSRGSFQVKSAAPASTAQPKDDAREKQLIEREQKLTNQERETKLKGWVSTARADRIKLYESEVARLTKGATLTQDDKDAIQELADSRMSKAISGQADFEETLRRYISADNFEGYSRYLANFYRQNMPKVVAAAVGAIVKHSAGKKVVAPTNGVAKPAVPGASRPSLQPAPAGVVRVATKPPNSDIDLRRTTTAMIASGQAFLKNTGKRVQWR